MQEQLIKLLADRVGLDDATAEKVVNTVVGYLKENPQQITSLLGGEDGKLGLDDVSELKDRLGGLFGKR